MAYLRTSFSIWYCYWLASTEEHKDGPVFQVWPPGTSGSECVNLSHREIRKDIGEAVERCCRASKSGEAISESDRDELADAMRDFLRDVDRKKETKQ